MTWALCFNCGATKFGAICPCPECKIASTGNWDLDIAFSDHRLSKDTLKAFGEVVRAIRRVCDDGQLRFWSFIYYVSTRHPDVLGVKLPEDEQERCAAVLARASPPAVTVKESEHAQRIGKLEEKSGDAQ
jgi:hypothetical protein